MSRLVPVTITGVCPLWRGEREGLRQGQRDSSDCFDRWRDHLLTGGDTQVWACAQTSAAKSSCVEFFGSIFFFLSLIFWHLHYRKIKNRNQRWDKRRSSEAAPVDAPLWLNLGDAGILHVLKAQVFLQMGLVYAHRHGHVAVAVQGGVSSARQPLAAAPAVMMGGMNWCACLPFADVAICTLTFQ